MFLVGTVLHSHSFDVSTHLFKKFIAQFIAESNETIACLAENQKCGFISGNPQVGNDCCQGFECKYEFVGGWGKCTTEGNLSYLFTIKWFQKNKRNRIIFE